MDGKSEKRLTREVTRGIKHLNIERQEEDEEIQVVFQGPKMEVDEPRIKRRCGNSDEDDDVIIVHQTDWEPNHEHSALFNPNARCYSFASLLKNDHEQIYGKFVRNFACDNAWGPANHPLAIAYDEKKGEWILADSSNGAIRVLSRNSNTGDLIRSAYLKYPSAIVVVEPGKCFAVLDNNYILLYDYDREAFFPLVKLNSHCRGLGLTSKGDLVTIKQDPVQPMIQFYSTRHQDRLLAEFPYEYPQNQRGMVPKPCFIDIANDGATDRVVITDLGLGLLSLYDLDARNHNLNLVRQIPVQGDTSDKFKFISGAKFDVNCDIFVTDARGYNLKYLKKNGMFEHTVKFDDWFAYASNFCINSKNELLVVDRRNGNLKLYELGAKDSLDSHLDAMLNRSPSR